VAGPPTVAEVVDLVVRMEDDAQRRISLDGFPDQFFRAAVEEELVAQDGIFVFAQIVGDAVNEGLLGYRREHAGHTFGLWAHHGRTANSRHVAATTRLSAVSRWRHSFASDGRA
jgi:hypothetical protein